MQYNVVVNPGNKNVQNISRTPTTAPAPALPPDPAVRTPVTSNIFSRMVVPSPSQPFPAQQGLPSSSNQTSQNSQQRPNLFPNAQQPNPQVASSIITPHHTPTNHPSAISFSNLSPPKLNANNPLANLFSGNPKQTANIGSNYNSQNPLSAQVNTNLSLKNSNSQTPQQPNTQPPQNQYPFGTNFSNATSARPNPLISTINTTNAMSFTKPGGLSPPKSQVNPFSNIQAHIPQATTAPFTLPHQLPVHSHPEERTHVKTESSPFNLYHTRLLLRYLTQKNASHQEKEEKKEFKSTKVKDSPYFNQIIIMISSMLQTFEILIAQKNNSVQLNKQADELIALLKRRLASSRMLFIQRLKFDGMLREIEEGLALLERELFNCVRPLAHALEARRPIKFEHPDGFSLQIATTIHARVQALQNSFNKMTEESKSAFQAITAYDQENAHEATRVISNVTASFEQACVRFEAIKEQYEELTAGLALDSKSEDSNTGESETIGKVRQALARWVRKVELSSESDVGGN